MELSSEIKKSIDKCVLCWLATSNKNMPNVSPKEIFTYYGSNQIIIANIASPTSVKNIKANQKVCLSFVDILVQKGYKLEGAAQIIDGSDQSYAAMEKPLTMMTEGKYPFNTIILITITNVNSILAPSYLFYPKTSEKQRIEAAKKAYGFE